MMNQRQAGGFDKVGPSVRPLGPNTSIRSNSVDVHILDWDAEELGFGFFDGVEVLSVAIGRTDTSRALYSSSITSLDANIMVVLSGTYLKINKTGLRTSVLLVPSLDCVHS
jgi:hypothetical protein